MHSKRKCRFLLAFYFFIRTFAEENGNSGNAEFFFNPINVIGLILINKAI